ncbi:MAG: hypothetical protein KDK45_24055, partial [Leptospiraceae bacterium]|nr:hypothetical protein [Leptospiraceae bacterium]
MKKIIQEFSIFFVFSTLFLYAQDTSKYRYIKDLLNSGQIGKAKQELDLALKVDKTNPTLIYYQTELNVAEAEKYYQEGKYEKALSLYEKIIKSFPQNSIVQAKYIEIKKKLQGKGSSKPVALNVNNPDDLKLPEENLTLNKTEDELKKSESSYKNSKIT